MTDNDDFSRAVQRTLHRSAERVSADGALIERLVANARNPLPAPASVRPLRAWFRPLLAAAAVAIVGAGAVGIVAAVNSQHGSPAAPHPTVQVTTAGPSPTASAVPTTTAPTSTPSATAAAVPAGFHLASAYFLDADLGWAIGDATCATTPATDCASLIATTDGGGSWHALGLPSGLVSTLDDFGSCGTNGGINGPCVNRVLFATARDGYLWSFNTFYSTTDGGMSWKPEAGGRALDVVSDGAKVLRLSPVHDCSSGCPGALQVSDAGSTTWRTVTPGGQTPALFGTRLTAGPSGFFVLSVSMANVSSDSGATVLYHSVDGVAWTAVHQYDDLARFIDNPADGSVVAFDSDGTSVSVSADGGRTFAPPRMTVVPSTTSGSNLAAASDSVMVMTVATTAQTRIYRTQDGGRSWAQVATLPGTAEATSPRFTSATDGYLGVRGQSVIVTTSDGGQTWTSHPF